MTVDSHSYISRNNLIEKESCPICITTIHEKINSGTLCFYGHTYKSQSSKGLSSFHVICGDCNPSITERAANTEAFRKCFHCNLIFPENFRKKFTLDSPEAKKFKVESQNPLTRMLVVVNKPSKEDQVAVAIILGLVMIVLTAAGTMLAGARVTEGLIIGLGAGVTISLLSYILE